MELNEKQKVGLDIAVKRYKEGQRYTVISGYAGSGKSTLVRFIVSALGIPEEKICYACYTGKAAQVLLKKGNKNVKTLHKLLYKTTLIGQGRYLHTPVTSIPYDIVIVDEVSMAPRKLMELLFTHQVYVICLGDPFQLPPVDKDQDNGLLAEPHVFLDEIMRQAQESEIIQLTMKIRAGEPLELFDGKDVKVVDPDHFSAGMMLWADQILCGTNKTRLALNAEMRELLGKSGPPQDGDKIICLRNYWEEIADNEDPLVNGTIGYLKDPYTTPWYYLKALNYRGKNQDKIDVLNGHFVSDSNAGFSSLRIDKGLLTNGQKDLPAKAEFALQKKFTTAHLIPKEFAYGYAITTHKAQGSQWDKVLVVEESFPFDRTEHARWLYTACTRAVDKLVVVRA